MQISKHVSDRRRGFVSSIQKGLIINEGKVITGFCHTVDRPRPVVEVEEEEDEMEDESELLLEKVEEDMAAEISDEDEEDILHLDDMHNLHIGNKVL